MDTEKQFPNGFQSWAETNYEVVSEIKRKLESEREGGPLTTRINQNGRRVLIDIAISITDEFEKRHEGFDWDGEWDESVWAFVDEYLNRPLKVRYAVHYEVEIEIPNGETAESFEMKPEFIETIEAKAFAQGSIEINRM